MKPTLYTALYNMEWGDPEKLGVYPNVTGNDNKHHKEQLQKHHNNSQSI